MTGAGGSVGEAEGKLPVQRGGNVFLRQVKKDNAVFRAQALIELPLDGFFLGFDVSVGIRMNPDFTFTVELPDGKVSKSLPKKGADPEKYDTANSPPGT